MKPEKHNTFALITGVSSGLGKAMALYFADQGVRVVGVSRTQPDGLPDGIHWIQADLTDEADRIRIENEVRTFCSGK